MLTPKIEAILGAALVAANLLAFTAIVTPMRARLDLTSEREYTVSDVTKAKLQALPDDVEILGFLSEETHPKLAPLVPMIRDMLEEYRIHAGGKLKARVLDPRGDEAAEKEAYQRFQVRPTPFRLDSKYEQGVKSAYFTLAITFGDQVVKLDVDDLIQVKPAGDDVVVSLKNLEYQLTSAIDKVVREFGSLDMRLGDLKEPVRFECFISEPERAPEGEVRELVTKKRAQVQEAIDGLKGKLKKNFEALLEDPAAKPGRADEVRATYGLTPIRASYSSNATIWLDAVVRLGNKAERILVRDQLDKERSSGELKEAVEAAVRRLIPGALKKIGIVSSRPKMSPEEMMQYYQRGMELPDDFRQLRQSLRRTFEVADVDLASGKPPLEVDVLLILKPKEWTKKHELALDQYLMFGGKAIVCVDQAELAGGGRGGLALEPVPGVPQDLLARYGVTVRKELLQDDANFPFPLPATKSLGGLRVQVVEQVPYPYFLEVGGDQIDRASPVLAAIDEVQLLWASPLEVSAEKTKGLEVTRLFSTSDKAWTQADLRSVEPRLPARGERVGYTVPAKVERYPVAVALAGKLTSAFKDQPEAVTGAAGTEPVFESPATTRLAVIGDADFVSDIGANVAGQIQRTWKGGAVLEGLIGWMLVDDELGRIRSRGASDRPLMRLEPETKKRIELANYAAPIGLVVLFGLVRALLRSSGARRTRGPSMAERGAKKAAPAAEPVSAGKDA